MPAPAARPPAPAPRRFRHAAWPLLCALGVAAVMILVLKGAEDRVKRDAGAAAAGAGVIPQVADVDRALEAMSLITVILETKVTSAAHDESWRGDVEARVTVPVRLMFGTDLAQAHVEVSTLGPLARTYTIHAPQPRRLATELLTSSEQASVSLGWLRYRTRAGEFYLGQARKALSDQAAAMILSDDESARVREETRRRLEALVRLVLGSEEGARARVSIVFADEDAPAGEAPAPREASANLWPGAHP